MPISNADYEISITDTVDLSAAPRSKAAVVSAAAGPQVKASAGPSDELGLQTEAAGVPLVQESPTDGDVKDSNEPPAPKRWETPRPAAPSPRAPDENLLRRAQNKIDSAHDGLRNSADASEELEGILEQAVSLIEKLSSHPGIREAGAVKARLERVEQQIQASQSGNT